MGLKLDIELDVKLREVFLSPQEMHRQESKFGKHHFISLMWVVIAS
jgi:hypothetical protein